MKPTHLYLAVLGTALAVMPAAGGPAETTPATNNPAGADPAAADRAEQAAVRRAMDTFLPAMDAQGAGQTVDFSALREAMGKFWVEFPDAHKSVTLLTFYMDMFAKANPERVQAEWASFTE